MKVIIASFAFGISISLVYFLSKNIFILVDFIVDNNSFFVSYPYAEAITNPFAH